MNSIETLTGDVNLRDSSAKCFIFHCPRAGGPGAEERHLGIAAKSPQTAEVVATVSPYPIVIPAVQGYSAEVGGKMMRMIYAVADGEVLKVFVNRRAGGLPVSACQFLRVRSGAALRTLELKLLTDAAVNHPYGMIRGRFDLLTLAEARALGVKVNEQFTKMFGPGAVGHCIVESVVSPELSQVVTVHKTDGTVATVESGPKRRRAIILPPSPPSA